jgi:hypothetical protein
MTENEEVPVRKRRSREEIQRQMMEFEPSRLRQNEFCRKHGLALSTLQRQLKKRRLDQGEAKSNRLVAVELASKDRDRNNGTLYALEVVPAIESVSCKICQQQALQLLQMVTT